MERKASREPFGTRTLPFPNLIIPTPDGGYKTP